MHFRTQQELPDFTHFSCVFAHEYFGDLASGKIFTETNWRPSVSTRGRGIAGATGINGVLRAGKSGRNRNKPIFLIFRVCWPRNILVTWLPVKFSPKPIGDRP